MDVQREHYFTANGNVADEKRVVVDPSREAAFGANEQTLATTATDELTYLSPQFSLLRCRRGRIERLQVDASIGGTL